MYIYIVTHPKFEGWIKLGRAINLEDRLTQYQTHCPDRSFNVEFKIDTKYPDKIERYFRNNIKGNGYEWFNCSVEFAINKIKEQLELIQNDNNYLSKPNSCKYIKKGMPTNIVYDYLVDGKIFNSLNDLLKYINMTYTPFYKMIKNNKFGQGKIININGYEIIRKNHEIL
jgi:hypothetical protein